MELSIQIYSRAVKWVGIFILASLLNSGLLKAQPENKGYNHTAETEDPVYVKEYVLEDTGPFSLFTLSGNNNVTGKRAKRNICDVNIV